MTDEDRYVLARAGPDDRAAIAALDELGGPTRRLLARDLAADDRWFVVVRQGGEVIGVASVQVAVGEAHLLDLVVARAHRRRGLGRRLVRAVRDVAREAGAAAMTLEVRAGNTAAIALYRDLGFQTEGARPGYYPDGGRGGRGEDAVIMWDRHLHD